MLRALFQALEIQLCIGQGPCPYGAYTVVGETDHKQMHTWNINIIAGGESA